MSEKDIKEEPESEDEELPANISNEPVKQEVVKMEIVEQATVEIKQEQQDPLDTKQKDSTKGRKFTIEEIKNWRQSCSTFNRELDKKSNTRLCPDCSYVSISFEDLRKHQEREHQVQHCDECNFSTKEGTLMAKHQEAGHKKAFSCDQCDFSAKSLLWLRKHTNIVHDKISFACDLCDYVADVEKNLAKHMKRYHSGKNYPCDLCNFKASTPHRLKRHKATHEKVCNECDFKTNKAINMIRHRSSKHEGKKICCDQCLDEFQTESGFRRHMIVKHERTKKYACDQCEYFAYYESDLITHKRFTHTGNTFPCEYCDFVGPREYFLQLHINKAHPEYRHRCSQCKFATDTRAKLKQHRKKVHEVPGETKTEFPCEYCDHVTTCQYFLTQHINQSHLEVRYRCNMCKFATDTRSKLRKHKDTDHPTKPKIEKIETQ